MNKKTLKATKGSAKKWVDIAEGKGVDRGQMNCPLCGLFFNGYCRGCPVMDKTGSDCCRHTPYTEWDEHHRVNHVDCWELEVQCPECKEIALKEVAFLEGLLP